jgi:hypothetical protein
MCICMCTYMYVYLRVYTCMSVCTCICEFTHTHTHTHATPQTHTQHTQEKIRRRMGELMGRDSTDMGQDSSYNCQDPPSGGEAAYPSSEGTMSKVRRRGGLGGDERREKGELFCTHTHTHTHTHRGPFRTANSRSWRPRRIPKMRPMRSSKTCKRCVVFLRNLRSTNFLRVVCFYCMIFC